MCLYWSEASGDSNVLVFAVRPCPFLCGFFVCDYCVPCLLLVSIVFRKRFRVSSCTTPPVLTQSASVLCSAPILKITGDRRRFVCVYVVTTLAE